jgi:hypothetical protein
MKASAALNPAGLKRTQLIGLAALALVAFGVSGRSRGALPSEPPSPAAFAGEKTTWHKGFDRYDFVMDDATGAITPMTAPAGEVTGFGVDTAVNDGKRRCGMTSLYWRLAALRILCCG